LGLSQGSLGLAPKPRIEALSDLVFGLALSIGALALINQQPSSLNQLLYTLFAFAFSFLILVSVWYRYSTIMSVLPVETTGLTALNLLMLLLVSVEPYLLNLLVFESPTYNAVGEYASIFYAVDIAGLNAILGVFTYVLAIEENRLVPNAFLRRYRLVRDFLFVVAAFYLLSVLPFFWSWKVQGIPVRLILWVVILPIGWTMRFVGRPAKSTNREKNNKVARGLLI
jgi:uncharacterized membrane protein